MSDKMARQQDFNDLFNVRNNFYIGNYQQCINEAQKIKVNGLSHLDTVTSRDAMLPFEFPTWAAVIAVLPSIMLVRLTNVSLIDSVAFPDLKGHALRSFSLIILYLKAK